MAPASSPYLSWSRPSVAETSWAVSTLNDSGSEPYLSWAARFSAAVLVKLPVISVVPVITPWVAGAETTLLSRTTAIRSLAPLLYVSLVRSVHLPWPALLNWRVTFQPPAPWVSNSKLAPETSVPTALAISSRYFSRGGADFLSSLSSASVSFLSQEATCRSTFSIDPGWRLSSMSQVMLGTLYRMFAGTTASSSPLRVANFFSSDAA